MDTDCPYTVDLYFPHAADMYTRLYHDDLMNAIVVWGLFFGQNALSGESRNHRIVDSTFGRTLTLEASYNIATRLRVLGGGLIGFAPFGNFRIRYLIRLVARRHGNN